MNRKESYFVSHENIPVGELAPTFDAYHKKYRYANVTEQHIKSLMDTLQNIDDNIVFLGGQTVRPFTMGHRQMRSASYDIDMYVPNHDVLSSMYRVISDQNYTFVYNTRYDCYLMELEGNPVSISCHDIYGTHIYLGDDTREYANIHMMRPEVLSALKLKRKAVTGALRGKDITDISSLLLSSLEGKIGFDRELHLSTSDRIGSQTLYAFEDIITRLGSLRKKEKQRLCELLSK